MPKTRQELIARVQAARRELEEVVERLESSLEAPAGDDGWRVRDVLAHIAVWERVAAEKLGGGASDPELQATVPDPWDLDTFNDANRQRWGARPTDEVLREFGAAHEVLLQALQTAPEAHFAADGAAEQVVEDDSAGHYHAHLPDLRAAARAEQTAG